MILKELKLHKIFRTDPWFIFSLFLGGTVFFATYSTSVGIRIANGTYTHNYLKGELK